MSNFHITNSDEIDEWLFHHVNILGHQCNGVKGTAPEGMCWDDGDPVTCPVNIAWRDTVTGDEIPITRAAKALGE